MSSLAKICDPKTYDMVLKVTARLMIQVNIPEHYLSLVQDPPKTTAEERLTWLKKVLLPRAACLTREPRFEPTRLLTAAIWLCLKWKFFKGGTQPKKHAPHLRFGPSSCQSYCQGKCTLVALVELPRESARGPTQQSVKATWQGKTPNLPQRSEQW